MIEAEALSKQFDSFWAVREVTFTVKMGEILALLGQNGAGKTTTIRMLNALLRPTRGRARIMGYDTVEQPEAVHRSVGMLTEQHSLYLRMNGYEYLEFYARLYGLHDPGERRRRITSLLEYFGLGQAASRRCGEYSKGMRQKLSLARALIHEPPVLLLDEPTSAMDPEAAQLVRQEILRLRSKNRAILISTHNLTEAEMLADRIAIIAEGRILATGTPQELKREVFGEAEYLLRFQSPWEGAITLPESVEVVERKPMEWRLRVPQPQTMLPLIWRGLLEQGAALLTLQEVPRSLEETYLAVMARARERGEIQ
ncbi:MAG: ABC transporter ATP-binding protein [Chloroflexi bacterium]|jgi:ABC-2 type transport system ATP-binding protein|nr:ABC transporter ATP-binding protein [Chloroflexota bacterium]